jgi:hypothetical protein
MNDFFLFPCEDTEAAAALTVDVACTPIAKRFGLDPRRDVQVLAPMHRGPAGAGTLNVLLQQQLTPARDGVPERRVGGRVFRTGMPGDLRAACGEEGRFRFAPRLCCSPQSQGVVPLSQTVSEREAGRMVGTGGKDG